MGILKGDRSALASSPPERVPTQRKAVTMLPVNAGVQAVCRNIKTLFNFEPPATEVEIRDASLQFVRKLSGFNVPSKANEAAFERAVEQVAASARQLIQSLVTSAEPKSREVEAARAKEWAQHRFAVRP